LKKILVLIVTVPNSNRIEALEQSLEGCPHIRILKIPAVMYHRDTHAFNPNYSKQVALYGNELSDGEIGCAISHQLIYDKYKSEKETIVVLEDDARVKKVDHFVELVSKFIERYSEKNAVLSLLPWDETTSKKESNENLLGIIPLVGNPPLTVGYVITPKAMLAMSKINFDFSYLPDWPPGNTRFYITKQGVVSHGDSSTESLIDKLGRAKKKRNRIIIKLFFIPYFLNKRHFSGVREYFDFAIKPSFTWRVDKIRLRYFSKSRFL